MTANGSNTNRTHLPTGWGSKLLREVAAIQSGIAKNSNREVSDPLSVHYLRVANVQDGFLDLSEMSSIQISRSELRRYSVLSGDVLMNEGGDLDQLGRGTIWRGQYDPCVHQNHVFVVRCLPALHPEYLNYWTSSTPSRRYFLLAGKQTTNLASINKTAIGELPVCIPPFPEQRAIAAALSDVDELVGALDKLITKKRAVKLATMQQLLTGETRLPGFEREWMTCRQGEVAEFINGRAYGRHEWETSGVPVCRLQNLTGSGDEFYYSNLKLSDKQYMEDGDLIFMWSASFGPYIWHGPKAIYHYHIWKIVCDDERADRNFYYYKLVELTERLKSTTDGSTMLHLTKKGMEQYEIILPPVDEQAAIAEVLTDMSTEITALEQRRDKTRAIKQGMMQSLLTGHIRLVDQLQVAEGSGE